MKWTFIALSGTNADASGNGNTTASVSDITFLQDGSVVIATINGAWQATTPTGTFNPVTGALQFACLKQRDDGTLFGCGANWDPDNMALGQSSSAPGGPWTQVFRFVQMAGPLSCPAGTVQHDTCALVLWPSVKEQFGIPDPTPDAAPALDAPTPPKKASGCCDSGSGGAWSSVIIALAVVFGGLLVRRGKRKKKCCS